MGKIIALANQKGGVGKTTSSINLAASLVKLKKRVLLVDFDPQGNATMGSGVDKSQLEFSVNEVLLRKADVSDVILSTQGKYDLLPGNADLTEAEVGLIQEEDKEFRLKHALNKVASHYDYIIIDCPPSLNMLTINALASAEGVLIPMQCEYYALEGLAALLGTISEIATHLNPELKLDGILRTMYDPRNRLTVDVTKQLFAHFPEQVYQTSIPRNVRLAEAPSYGLPALAYDRRSIGAKAYLNLAKEMLKRHKAHRDEKRIVDITTEA